MGGTPESDGDKNTCVPAERGSQEAANVGSEVNASTTSGDLPATAAISSAPLNQDNIKNEKNTEEQQVNLPSTANNSTQRKTEEGGDSLSQNVTQQQNVHEAAAEEGPVTSQYVSLSANPSKDGSASTDSSDSGLLKDFLENFLSQETDAAPADSMHVRGDGQVEISQHDDAGNLFALEADNRSVVDIHHANDGGYAEGEEGRASAASLCVINGEQDDISVLTELEVLELPESMSDAEDNGWVSFEINEGGGGSELNHKLKSPMSTSTFFSSSNRRNDLQREKAGHSMCADLCGIDRFASSTTQWLQAQLHECGGMFPERANQVLHAVGLWYQNLVQSNSSNGDAMKRLAETKKMERRTMREAQSILTNSTSVDVTASVEVTDPEEKPTTAECIVALEFNGETRDDIAASALQEKRSPTDAEEREDDENSVVPKAPVGILKKSKYQPKVNPDATAAGPENKKKAKKAPKASPTTPRRTPKSTRQYADTGKKFFWGSKSPKAVPVPGFKRQKGWTASKNEPSDYAIMI